MTHTAVVVVRVSADIASGVLDSLFVMVYFEGFKSVCVMVCFERFRRQRRWPAHTLARIRCECGRGGSCRRQGGWCVCVCVCVDVVCAPRLPRAFVLRVGRFAARDVMACGRNGGAPPPRRHLRRGREGYSSRGLSGGEVEAGGTISDG